MANELTYLICGKGGNSFNSTGGASGAGAGGQVLTGLTNASIGTFPMVVGVAGNPNSSAFGLTATEGGNGGVYDAGDDIDYPPTSNGSGAGGNSVGGINFLNAQGGAGAGGLASGNIGGIGFTFTLNGKTYGKGGNGGLGVGGVNAPAANPNTGNGCDGAGNNRTGNVGGSGEVVVAYLTGTLTATGGTITTNGLYTLHTFTTSADFIITAIATPPPEEPTMDTVTINITEQPINVVVNVTEAVSTPQNVFIQQAAPTATGNYVWFELRNDNTLKTIWIKT